jgi:hypothetical protein
LKRGRKKLTDLRRIWFAEKKLFGFDHGLWYTGGRDRGDGDLLFWCSGSSRLRLLRGIGRRQQG